MKLNVQNAAVALAFAMLACLGARAQSPGGVSANLRVWLRSDNGFTPASWTDGSGNANHYTQTNASRQPFVAADYYNFNPVVDFGTSGSDARFMVVPAGKPYSANGTSSSIFTVNLDRAAGGYGDIIGFGASTTTASLINANSPVLTRLGTNVVNYPYGDSSPALPAVVVNKLYINDVSFTVGTAGIKYGQNGTIGANTQTFTAGNSKHADGSVLGSQPEVRNGLIGEVIAYERDLSEAEKQRVRTYTAIKYGITLPHNYIASNGSTIIWNQATNAGYNNNIAGIAKDDNGALHQKQSRSINNGNQVLIGTAGLANTNTLNTTGLTNGQFLVWGDNGLAKSPSIVTNDLGADVNARFASLWKVQNVGTGTVRVAWPKGLDNLKLIQSGDAVIDGSDVVTAMSAETAPINGIVYNYADVTLADGQFFTFAAKVNAPGGVVADLRVWLKSDNGFTPAQWNDFSGNANHYTQTNASRQPFTATTAYNFNPVVDFGTTGSNARFMVVPAGKPYSANGTNSTMFTVNLDRSVGGYADILGFGATTTGSGLINANSPVFTRLGQNVVNYPYADSNPALPAVVTNRLYLNDVSFTVGTAGIKYGQNGTTSSNTQTFSAVYAQHADGSVLGSQPEERNGLIGEVIAYERNLTEAEKQRVRTYTAIKYGITLPHNYIASNGTTVIWDQTVNTGYRNNIAGIASDETSALVQKQSKSINTGSQVLIATTGLTDNNASNLSALDNGKSLLWGDNGLSKTLSSSFSFPSVPTLNLRFAAIWKVQNTGSVGTVRVTWPAGIPNLTLIQSADATIDDTDTRTDMTANSISVNGVSYNYADVTLSDGQYFTFAGFVSGPGNVASAAWYRADAAGQQFSDAGTTVAADGATIQQWNEYKGTGFNLTQASAGDRPAFSNTSTLANFNPTVTFNGSQWMRYTAPTGVDVIDRANGSIFAAGYMNSLQNVGFAGFHSSMDYPGLHTYLTGGNYNLLFFTGGPGYQGLSGNSFVNKNYFTIGSGWENGQGSTAAYAGATVSLNGNRTVYSGTNQIQNAVINTASRDFQIGQDDNHGPLNGQLNEVVVFEQRLSEDEMNRVETYMAIKYGTTYAAGTKDYVNSSSTPVWTSATNIGYHFNIAGVARDDMGSLYQKQSWSTNPGRQVLISTTGLDNTNASNSGVLGNNQFLTWGDNNLAKAPTVSIAGISGVNYRFASIWKTQNTNGVGTVRVAWPKGYANLKLIQSADATIDASDAITAMENSQTVNGIEYAYVDVTLANGQYFTFAAFIQAPGGVTSNLSYWYRADKLVDAGAEGADVVNWTDFTSGTTISQLGDNALPVLKNGASDYFNYNPGINFTAATQSLGNIGVQTITNLNFDIYTLTKEGISPGFNGRIFSSLVNNTNITGSIAYWDGIGLIADQRLERVNNAFGARYLANPGGAWATTYPSITYNKFTDLSLGRSINGNPTVSNGVHTARGAMTGGFAIGSTQFSSNGSDNAGFTGNIGEMIIYGNGNNSDVERNKVESYLAIKYGLTLDNSNNYTTSGGTVVWDKDANSAHYNNVAGIGNDFMSALHQKQSRSQHTNTNNQVIISLGEIAATNAANAGSLSDGQFLVWGDNGNTQAMTNTASTYTAFTYAGSASNGRRMNRVWKVQNTNNVSNDVQIRFPIASVGTTTFATGDACGDYVIIFADDAAFTTNVTVKALTVNGTDYDLAHNFPNGASYFTYGKVTPFNQGVVYLPATTETTNNSTNACDVGTWKYFRKTADNTQKLMGITGYTDPELANLAVTITPLGASYDDGSSKTNLMARITTVTNSGSSPLSAGKVRIYYSIPEKNATAVQGEQTFGWFKYQGTADEVIANVYAYGKLDVSKAVSLTPDATGVEDGVNYVEFHNLTSFSSFVYLSTTQESALPVTMAYFNAAKEGNTTNLTWATTEEVNNTGFEIQRSADARKWQAIGFVENQTADGNSKNLLTYGFADTAPLAGTNYYRLKQIDTDGSYAFSSIAAVRFESDKNAVSVYPNPVVDGKLSLKLPKSGSYKLSVYNVAGMEVLNAAQSGNTLDIKGLRAGVYVLRVTYPNGEVHSKTFVVK
ncbi:Por secretion system C-terminal sorting domain-containing protein [Dyadobacter soli]|uniref:Por secretion system C-terminal sorting domain-containing protein n=1 Tax=Dyadobacter soli TaxID=659014 RepID=A0A1G7D6X5_9BACT|nr:T9SS type A sorting domain-containing protein [Dyadobacter soli]SDE46515.1 Por secretion system C-terminal sorting domain-containing protein [Dyadobacter soli]